MKDGIDGKPVRRRRSWYRRRIRNRRILLTTAMLLLLVGVCWQRAAHFLALPTLHTTSLLPESFWTRGNVHKNLVLMAHSRVAPATATQPTYPYSVIPGGVHDAAELREVAARDYVVRRHFGGFDFSRARLVRSDRAREVYLSYRIRDHVYWTRKKVRLLAAELLLTDGKITARTRCGNQVSEMPKGEVSDEEPETDVLDEPVTAIDPIGPSLPFRFAGPHPEMPGTDVAPPHGPELFAARFYFPYVEFGVPIPPGVCKPGDDQGGGEKGKRCKKHHKPPVVPEPASILLLCSGLAGVTWRYVRSGRKDLA